MSENYSIEGTMLNGELVGKPTLKVPHHILLKFLDLAEFYQSLENKDPEAVDREFTKFIYRQVSWTASKYRPGKKEKKVASELKQYSEALQLFFYDLDDKDG